MFKKFKKFRLTILPVRLYYLLRLGETQEYTNWDLSIDLFKKKHYKEINKWARDH